MSLQFWAWLLITVVLIGFELAYRDLLIAPFAAGAACATALEAFGASPAWQWGVLVGVSSVLTVWLQRVVAPRRARTRPTPER